MCCSVSNVTKKTNGGHVKGEKWLNTERRVYQAADVYEDWKRTYGQPASVMMRCALVPDNIPERRTTPDEV